MHHEGSDFVFHAWGFACCQSELEGFQGFPPTIKKKKHATLVNHEQDSQVDDNQMLPYSICKIMWGAHGSIFHSHETKPVQSGRILLHVHRFPSFLPASIIIRKAPLLAGHMELPKFKVLSSSHPSVIVAWQPISASLSPETPSALLSWCTTHPRH